ncbi:Gamma-glutamylputrescine oxidoreductase [Erysiphe neolycopersici]|uniref:Gamma-glutamylputrescine oxidoreductase n=1 Tax=Erysiphe neolycopersici TaxID=212602 RepID=A0A420HTW8_9PEZI|nr:Gamma-glutamylputrescine oxidoreductase [Erysiphe neolycopersici]
MGSLSISSSNEIFPSNESLPTFWRSELHPLDSHRSTEVIPKSCDVLILGAGYAGSSTAYHLLCNDDVPKMSPKPSVLLLEARQACSGATARNGGHLRPSIFGRLPRYLKEYGIDTVLELVDFESDQVEAIAALVEKEKIDCDFTRTKSVNAYVTADDAMMAKKAYLKLKNAGLSKAVIQNIMWFDGDEAEKISGVKGAIGCLQFKAAQLWPYKLVMALLQRAVDSGLNLQTHTLATCIVASPTDPGKWIVNTSRGPVTASKVIFATNAFTAGLLPEYHTKIVPAKGICCRIVYSPDTPHLPLENSHCIWLENGSCDYLLARSDNSIIVGGARCDFFSNMSNWYNRTDDDTLIESARFYFNRYMQKYFVGWEKSDAHVDNIWTGIMGYNSDSLPNIGAVPDRPGCFIQAGFQGNGMPQIFLVSKALVEMVVTGKSYEEVRIPSLYRTSKERLQSSTDHLLGLP